MNEHARVSRRRARADRREADEAAVTDALLQCAFKLGWNIRDFAAALDAAHQAIDNGRSATEALMFGAEAVKRRLERRPVYIGFDPAAPGSDQSVWFKPPPAVRRIRMEPQP